MQQVHRWQYQYIGTNAISKDLQVVELSAFFTYTPEELADIAKKRKAPLRIAAAIQLGFLKMTGNLLSDISSLPLRLLRHVASQLGEKAPAIATLRSIYDRDKTRLEHQWWAMHLLGFRKASKEDLAALPEYLNNEARYTPDRDTLMQRAKLWLYQHRFLSLSQRDLDSLAANAAISSEAAFLGYLTALLSEAQIKQWTKAVMRIEQKSQRTYLEWLHQPANKKSVNAIRERTARIDFLRSIGVDKLNLDSIPLEKIRAYAEQMRNIRPARFKELQDPLRTIRLVCFLKWSLLEATDTAIMLAHRSVTSFMGECYRNAQALEGKSAMDRNAKIQILEDKVNSPDISDAEYRQLARDTFGGLEPLKFPTKASAARWLMSEPNPKLRAILSELSKLDLKAEPNHPVVETAEYLQQLYASRVTELPQNHGKSYPWKWRELIQGEDRERGMRAMEAMTLVELRKSLKSGAVYVDQSEKFRGRHRLVISQEVWDREQKIRYAQLNLPLNPNEFLQSLVAELDAKLQLLEESRQRDEFQITDSRFRIPRYKPFVPSKEDEQNEKDLFTQINTVQLPDLILEMDSKVGFSKIILGRPALNSLELLQIYTGMLAHGCALDASAVCHMVPQLTANQVLVGMRYFEDKDKVRAANDAVTGYQLRLPICAAWGDGSLASSDMMSMDVSKQLWRARSDYRRKVASVGTYTAVSDFWSVFYNSPVILNERQAGPALDARMHQREFDVEKLAVDTHGYTEFAMAIAKLLGFGLCPRLAKLTERKLYVPKSAKIPEGLNDMVVSSVSLKAITQEWDNLVRLASSIETGHSSATVALASYGSASSDSSLYRAGVHLGRLIRSIYLCDYLSSEEFRRTIHRILVHGEHIHTLQRAIYSGSFSKPRGQYEQELHAASGSLTLMTNLCLAWTSNKMQNVLFGDSASAMPETGFEWLSHVSPAHIKNINFRGIFTFSVDEYAQWLFTSDETPKRRSA